MAYPSYEIKASLYRKQGLMAFIEYDLSRSLAYLLVNLLGNESD